MRSRNLPSLPSESRAILPGDTHPSSAEEPSTSGRSELADTEDEAGVEFETKRAGRGLVRTLLYDGLETRPDVVKVEEADENSLVDGIRMYGSEEDMVSSPPPRLASVVGNTPAPCCA